MDALDLPRHIDVVPARSQTLACGGDVPRPTWCSRVCLLVAVAVARALGGCCRFSCALSLALKIYVSERDTTLTRVSRIVIDP